jgi:uncharacterized membrane protein
MKVIFNSIVFSLITIERAASFTVLPSSTSTSTFSTLNNNNNVSIQQKQERGQALNLFGDMFEEAGPLGKGITVGKVQVALNSWDRSSTSITGVLEDKTSDAGDSPEELSQLTNDVCLALLRRSDDWIGAASESKHFKTDDAGKAESLFNEWSNLEASKFEKEYIPGSDSEEKGGGPTSVVVSLVVEIQGDETNFEGAGYSATKTRDVIASIASDCLVDEGYCLNAAEVFWTPGEKNEVLSKTDIIVDFPNLITL